MQPLWDQRYQPADADIVRRKAKKMMRRRTLRELEIEDIEQEMAMRVIQQSHLHRPDRGSREGFVGKTVENAYLTLYEKRTAKKREDKGTRELQDSTMRSLSDGRTTQEQIDLALDLEKVVNRMPPDLQQVYALLLAGHTKTDLEDLLNLTRGQARTLTQRLKQHLQAYLSSVNSENSTTISPTNPVNKE